MWKFVVFRLHYTKLQNFYFSMFNAVMKQNCMEKAEIFYFECLIKLLIIILNNGDNLYNANDFNI